MKAITVVPVVMAIIAAMSLKTSSQSTRPLITLPIFRVADTNIRLLKLKVSNDIVEIRLNKNIRCRYAHITTISPHEDKQDRICSTIACTKKNGERQITTGEPITFKMDDNVCPSNGTIYNVRFAYQPIPNGEDNNATTTYLYLHRTFLYGRTMAYEEKVESVNAILVVGLSIGTAAVLIVTGFVIYLVYMKSRR